MKKNKKIWSWALACALAVSNLSVVAAPFTGIVAQAALQPTGTLISDASLNAKKSVMFGVVGQELDIATTGADASVCVTPATVIANNQASNSDVATCTFVSATKTTLTLQKKGTVRLVVAKLDGSGGSHNKINTSDNYEQVDIEVTDPLVFSNPSMPEDITIHGGETKSVSADAAESGVDMSTYTKVYDWRPKAGSKLQFDSTSTKTVNITAPSKVTSDFTEEVEVEVVKYKDQYAYKCTDTFNVTVTQDRTYAVSVDAEDIEEGATADTYTLDLVEGESETKTLTATLDVDHDEDFDVSKVIWTWTMTSGGGDVVLMDEDGEDVASGTATTTKESTTSALAIKIPSGKAYGAGKGTLVIKAGTAADDDLYGTKTITVNNVGKTLNITGVYADDVTPIGSIINGDAIKGTATLTVDSDDAGCAWSSANSKLTITGSPDTTVKIAYAATGADEITVRDTKGRTGKIKISALSAASKAVEKVELSKEAIDIDVNGKQIISATTTPASPDITTFTWTSEDDKIASVAGVAGTPSSGTITGVKAGVTTITCTSDDITNGEIADTVEVTVNGISNAFISGDETVNIGDSITLTDNAETIGTYAAEATKTTTWEITDAYDADGKTAGLTAIATIDKNGALKGVAEGKVNVVANITLKNTSAHVYKATTEKFEVSVVPKTTSLEVAKDSIEIVGLGETETIEYTVTPSGQPVEFSSNDEAIATVDKDGVVTAVAEGTTKINVTSGEFTRTVTVTVSLSPEDEKTIAIAAAEAAADAAVANPTDATIAAAKAAVEAAKAYKATDAELKTATDKIAQAEAAKAKADEEAKKKAEEQKKAADGSADKTPAPVGTELKDANGKATGFKVTDANPAAPEVEFTGPADKDAKSVDIPEVQKDLSGNEYKVTSIAPEAFKDSKAKTVTIRKNIKKIDPNAFKNSKIKNAKIKGTKLTKKMAKAFKKLKKGGKITCSGSNKKKNKKYLSALKNVKNGNTKLK